MTLERTSNAEQNKLAVTLGTYGHTDHRSMIISHGRLESAASLTFERTLRVPDNQDVNSLPPSLGQFPLYSVAEYKHRMPEDMASKGGVFLPMYQREAMWIRFSAKEPFALKIYVGGVNAISGVPINETPEAMLQRLKLSDKIKQDYVILPEQPWLDGIASEDGRIRQFVAMPKGSGYSVEAQVTGEEKIGGLQFEITPVKRRCPSTLKISLSGGEYQQGSSNREKLLNLHEKGLGDSSTIMDLKRVIEKEFDVQSSNQALRLQQPSFTSAISDIHDEQSTFSQVWISEHHVLEVRDTSMRVADRHFGGVERDGVAAMMGAAPAAAFGGGAAKSESSSSLAYSPNQKLGMSPTPPLPPPQASKFPAPMAMPNALMSKAKKSSVVRKRSSSAQEKESVSKGPEQNQVPGGPTQPPAPKIEAMGLAAGGLIIQSINEDKYPASIWDPDSSILFNIQLLNSESFMAVTGLAPPDSPIDAKTYAQYGYPFFQIWDEELSGIKGNFDKVKSVGAMDEELATKAKDSFWEKLTGNSAVPPLESFKRDESIKFPIIMLDMSHRRTFKPLKEMEEESKRLKSKK